MENYVIIATTGAVVVGCLAFIWYHVYNGVHGCLYTARVGEVYNFEYLQPYHGEAKRFMVRVLNVETLENSCIERLNRRSGYRKNDPDFVRTNHLVTGESPDGTIRNFYAERVVNCKRPLLGKSLFTTGLAQLLV